jgi:hypothetical protein
MTGLGPIADLLLDPAGRRLALLTVEGEVALLPLAVRGERPRVPGNLAAGGQLLALAEAPGTLLAAEPGGRVVVWAVPGGGVRDFLPHGEPVLGAAVVGERSYAVLDSAYQLHLWSVGEDGHLVECTVELPGSMPLLAPVTAGDRLALWQGFDLVGVDVVHGRIEERVELLDGSYLDAMEGQVAFSVTGEALLVHWDRGQVFDARTGEPLARFPFVRGVTCAAVSGAGDRWALGGVGGWVHVGEKEGEPRELAFGAAPLRRVLLDAAGTTLAVLDEEGGVGVYDLERDRWRLRAATDPRT